MGAEAKAMTCSTCCHSWVRVEFPRGWLENAEPKTFCANHAAEMCGQWIDSPDEFTCKHHKEQT